MDDFERHVLDFRDYLLSIVTMDTVEIAYSASGDYYAIPGTERECGIWLSLAVYPLPVESLWRRPGVVFAAVMRGRDYYRVGMIAPQRPGRSAVIASDAELITDYRNATWWAPGLEEAWKEADQAQKQIEELTAPPVRGKGR